MSNYPNWKKSYDRFYDNVQEGFSLLGVDNDRNFLNKIKALLRKVEEAEREKQEWLDITNTVEIGAAKKRTRALMKRSQFREEFDTLPSVFLTVPRHWREGLPATKGCKGEPPMLPSKAEGKLRREVWPYLKDLFEELHLLSEIERTRTVEDLEDRFTSDPPSVFINYLYDLVNNLEDLQPDPMEEVVPLVELLRHCVGVYPDRLLQDCRDMGEDAGFVTRSWFNDMDARATAALTMDQKEEVARTILSKFVYKASGGSGYAHPLVQSEIMRGLSTERWQISGPEWIVSKETRLADLLIPIIEHTYTPITQKRGE